MPDLMRAGPLRFPTATPAESVPAAAHHQSLLPLEVRCLSFAAGGARLIDDVNLTVDGKGLTVMMGPNGAGKSLLLRLLHGLLPPDQGTIHWGGAPLSDSVRRRQALVFQRPVLLRRSVEANLRFALKMRGFESIADRVRDALALAGLETLASRPARVLSGGEQQRLALVRALSLEPDVILLDEPTASLDPAATLAIERLIEAARDRQVKVILVTHDIGQARRLADDIVFLHGGKVMEAAQADRFFTRPDSPAAQAYLDGRLYL